MVKVQTTGKEYINISSIFVFEYIDIFYINKNNTIINSIHSGANIDPKSDIYKNMGIVFPVIDDKKFDSVFIKLSGWKTNSGSFTILNEENYNTTVNRINYYLSLYLGIIVSLLVLNLFLFLKLKDYSFLYFIFLLISYHIITNLSKINYFSTIMPEQLLKYFSQGFIPGLFSLFIVITLTNKAINLKSRAIFLYKLSIAQAILTFILIAFFSILYIFNTNKIPYILFYTTDIIIIAIFSFVIFSAIYTWIKGSKTGYYYTLGLLFIFIGAIVTFLTRHRFLDVTEFTVYFTYLTGAIEAIIFSFTLADRIIILQEEHSNEKIKAEVLHNELEAVRSIDQSLLPVNFNLIVPYLEMSSHYCAAEVIGGDFFTYFYDKNQNYIYFFIADTTGHGVSAALVSAVACGSARAAYECISSMSPTKESSTKKENIINFAKIVNNSIYQSGIKAKKSVSVQIVGIDLTSGECLFVNGGHPFPYCINNNSTEKIMLNSKKQFGLNLNYEYPVTEYKLDDGDMVLMYTDGLFEIGISGSNTQSVKEFLGILSTKNSTEENKKIILDHFNIILNNQPLEDDYSFILFKWSSQ